MIKNNLILRLFVCALWISPLLGCSSGFNSAKGLSSVVDETPDNENPPVTNLADEFFSYAWHLVNTRQAVFSSQSAAAGNDLNLQNTWAQNIRGQGLIIRVSDDGIDDSHPDLTNNFNYENLSRRYNLSSPYVSNTSRPTSSTDNHGTAVAGIIAASYNNGLGAAGVAPNAQITSANFLSDSVAQSSSQLVDQASGTFDILNMSWGYSQNSIQQPYSPLIEQFKYNSENGRDGKGSMMVKAAGNDFFTYCNGSTSSSQFPYCTGNSNMDGDNSSPYTVLIAALAADAKSSSYSSTGSNIWISAMGGENGQSAPGIFTTDRAGCTNGYATTATSGNINFERGTDGNTNCNYTVAFSGTSAAAPMASGVLALIMQANPNLTWREIKYILAKTATQVDSDHAAITTHPLATYGNGISLPTGYRWEEPWVTNAANFKFHNWYGFGRINVDAAVELAQNFNENLGAFTTTNWANTQTNLTSTIPDNTATGVNNVINVTQNLKIEAVQIRLNVTHADISELAIELTSPHGTKSILMNARNSMINLSNYLGNEVLLSNAFYQEESAGQWTIKVVDAKASRTGTLTSWSINFFGSTIAQ